MISKFALAMANHFAEKDVYGRDKINVYKYGFELLISSVFNVLGILLISLIMHTVIGAMFFCVAFIPLRLAAGGYHAKHHWSCILGFTVIFFGFAYLHRNMNMEYALHYSLATVIVSSALIWAFAPVATPNKPLKDEHKKRQRDRSVIIACTNLAITLLFYIIDSFNELSPLLAFYNSGAFIASLSLAAAVLVDKKRADESIQNNR